MRQYLDSRYLWWLFGLGLFLRLHPYLYNRSLWFDEAMLANNIAGLSIWQLAGPLQHGQIAPIGFIYLEKLCYEIFGHSEYSLRLMPLLIGLISIPLFYRLALLYFNPLMARLALAFFVLCGPHIYYCSEVKQYIFDVGASLLVALLIPKLLSSKLSAKAALKYGLLAALLIPFSQPVIFSLGGLLLAALVYHRDCLEQLKNLFYFSLPWLFCFLVYFIFWLQPSMQDTGLRAYHSKFFMPLRFWEIESWQWYMNSWFQLFQNPGGIFFKYPAGMLALIGLCFGFRGRRFALLALALPVFIAIGASAFGLYSTLPRLMLFAIPALLILVVEGIGIIYIWLKAKLIKPRQSQIAMALLSGMLLLQPALDAIHRTAEPMEVEDVKSLLSFISKNWQPGDLLYVYHYAQPQYTFYQSQYPPLNQAFFEGRTPWEDWPKDFQNLRHKKRIWLLFSHDQRGNKLDRTRYTIYLDQQAKRLMEKETIRTACYLYDFSEGQTD